jgi:hypothetical protein
MFIQGPPLLLVLDAGVHLLTSDIGPPPFSDFIGNLKSE